jgi:hypothetical protein
MKDTFQGTVVENNARQHNENADALEALIDTYSLSYVIDLLAEVCSAKADHLVANWQDDDAGEAWDNNAERLMTVAHKARLSVG